MIKFAIFNYCISVTLVYTSIIAMYISDVLNGLTTSLNPLHCSPSREYPFFLDISKLFALHLKKKLILFRYSQQLITMPVCLWTMRLPSRFQSYSTLLLLALIFCSLLIFLPLNRCEGIRVQKLCQVSCWQGNSLLSLVLWLYI